MNDTEEYTLSSYEALVEGIVIKALESYDGNDVIVLASLLDDELHKEGIAMPFAWLWSRATFALTEW